MSTGFDRPPPGPSERRRRLPVIWLRIHSEPKPVARLLVPTPTFTSGFSRLPVLRSKTRIRGLSKLATQARPPPIATALGRPDTGMVFRVGVFARSRWILGAAPLAPLWPSPALRITI